jgi:hypothetical protein
LVAFMATKDQRRHDGSLQVLIEIEQVADRAECETEQFDKLYQPSW